MMKASKFLLLLLAAGILASTYFLFFRDADGRDDLGPGATQKKEEPDVLGGSLEADPKLGDEGSGNQGARAHTPMTKDPQGRRKARAGGASIALQLYLDGKPLADAKLRIHKVPSGREAKETTDRAGRARFEGLSEGRYMIRTDDQRVPKSFRMGPYRLAAKQALDLGRVEVPQAAALRFRLLKPGGSPLSDAEIRLYHVGNFGLRGVGLKGKTDKEGRGTFLGLSDGDWTLSVVTKEWPVFEKSVSLGSGANMDLGDLTLRRGFFVVGRVVDEQGKGIPEVRLIPSLKKEKRGLEVETFDRRAAVRTDTRGRFRFVTGAKQGRIRVRKEGYSTKMVPYRFQDGELRIVLARNFGISGNVLGAIPGKTEVYAHRIGSDLIVNGGMGGAWKRVSTGPKGAYHFEKLPPGEYGVVAFASGKGASMERRTRLLPGASQRVDLALKPGPKLDLTIVTKSGKPLSGVVLDLYYRSPLSPESKWGKEVLAMFIRNAKRPSVRLTTNPQGLASGVGLWKGKALLILKGKGLSEKVVSPVLLQAGTNSLRIEMAEAARVVGKAFGADGKPLVGAQISVDPVRSPGNNSVRLSFGSDGEGSQRKVQADGSFHIEGIKPGTYQVSLKPPLHKTGAFFYDGSEPSLDKKTVTLRSGEEAKVTLRARPQWTIEGRVLFQGEPVVGATVSMKLANPPRGFSFPSSKKTDKGGQFRFEWVGKGKYIFHATPPEKGVRTPKQVVDLPEGGGLRNLDIELGGGLVKGRIALEGDRPKGLELLLLPKDEAKTGTSQIVMVQTTSGNGGEAEQQNMVLGDGPTPVVPKKDGSFAFHFVAKGEWVLKIRAGEKRGKTTLKTVPLRLAKNQGLDLGDISLEKTFPVQLIVNDESGKPLKMAWVKIFPMKDGKSGSSPVFRGMIQNGKAKVPGLKVGSYRVVVRKVLTLTSPKKPEPPQEGRLEVLPGGKIRGGQLRIH